MTQPPADVRDIATAVGADTPLVATYAHNQLRSRILSGELAGGTVLSQVELAAELGISRTPLREALRMLQEEGLVEAEPNRRCRVAGFDAEDLDAIYGTRLMLEALGMRLTLPGLRSADLERAETLLARLDALGGPGEGGPEWQQTHHDFHRTFVAGAPQSMLDQITAQAQRCERYMYHLAVTLPDGTGRPAEHHQILAHVRAGELDDAIVATARHMARTPLLLLAETAAEFEPTTIRAAVSMLVALTPQATVRTTERRPRHRSA